MSPLRIAVIGCGGIAKREHYAALDRFPEMEIAGACDLDPTCLHATERDFPTGWYALTRHEGGCSGAVMLNWQAGGARPYDFELHGRGVSVFASLRGGARVLVEGEERPDLLAEFGPPPEDDPLRHYGFREENRHFVDCLLAGAQPPTNLADATKSMELADRVYQGAR